MLCCAAMLQNKSFANANTIKVSSGLALRASLETLTYRRNGTALSKMQLQLRVRFPLLAQYQGPLLKKTEDMFMFD
jgi:short-subunit dehydrogenase involved in D-alanine esterification of teichoic acids